MLNIKKIEGRILKKLDNETEESFSIWYKDLMRQKQANKSDTQKVLKQAKAANTKH